MDESNYPIPDFFDAEKVGVVWRIPYEACAQGARDWAHQHRLQPASVDSTKTWLMLIDADVPLLLPRRNVGVACEPLSWMLY